jgi:hypothetical protein
LASKRARLSCKRLKDWFVSSDIGSLYILMVFLGALGR